MFQSPTTELITVIEEIRTLYGIPTTPIPLNTTTKGAATTPIHQHAPPSTSPNSPFHDSYQSPTKPKTRSAHVYHDGTIVRKQFKEGIFEGEVTHYDTITKFYKIQYEDGDTEEMTYDEVKQHLKPLQEYSNRPPRVNTPRVPPNQLEGGTSPSSPMKPRRIIQTGPTTDGALCNAARDKAGKKRR
jgi:hypothetical protein